MFTYTYRVHAHHLSFLKFFAPYKIPSKRCCYLRHYRGRVSIHCMKSRLGQIARKSKYSYPQSLSGQLVTLRV